MRGLDYLIPEARRAAEDFLAACKAEGLNVLITDTLRTEKEQNDLYAQGRTKPGSVVTSVRYPHSPHNWGVAFDFCKNIRGAEYDDKDGFFEKVGAVAERLGLVWGGHFRKPDRPHIQLAKYAPDKTASFLIANYSDPDAFIREKTTEKISTKEDFRKALIEAITPEIAVEIVEAAFRVLAGEGSSEPWQTNAILWAADRGIMKGTAAGNLMPKKPATRAEVAQMFKNYDDYLTSLK